MITISVRTLFETTKSLLRNGRALAILAALYALLLATLYGFIATREATVWQVLITLFFLVLAPAEFFILQAAILNQARDSKFHWAQILRDSIKLALVTIPIILLGYALWVLLAKWQAHFPVPKTPITFPPAAPKPQPLHWPTLLLATLRTVLFAIVLPLATIHLWIEVSARELRVVVSGGVRGSLKRLGQVVASAFASQSVFTYGLGLIVFALIPYALLFVHRPIKGTKTDFAFFIARLVLVFAFTLFGWIVTLSALSKTDRAEVPVPQSQMGTAAEAAA